MTSLNHVQRPEEEPSSKHETDTSMAEAAFNKLPNLGPIAWLYARTQDRRFLFLTDLDWAVMPPVMLEQCRLFMRGKMPYAFVTWAHVNDEVHQRLLQGNSKLAPHEWHGGSHLWLIDVVTPFGGTQDVLADVQKVHFIGQPLRYLSRNAETLRNEVHTYVGPSPKVGNPSSTEQIVH